MNDGSPVTDEVATELTRLVRRWQQLPLDQALLCAPQVMAVAQRLADRVAELEARPRAVLPDLGPATAMDQLRVTTYDAARHPDDVTDLVEQLTGLRRQLA